MKIKSLLVLIVFSYLPVSAQDVFKLDPEAMPGPGRLSQLEWLAGYWKGTGFGGVCDEIWMPAADNSMAGIFRFTKDATIQFTEYIVIEEIEESLILKLKHFSRDLSPWEEKDKWLEFKLVRLEDHTAWFHGLTYQRIGDELIIKLELHSKGRTWVEEFRFGKSLI